MQLVKLPAWLYALIGIVLLVIGLVTGRLAFGGAGVVVLIAAALRALS